MGKSRRPLTIDPAATPDGRAQIHLSLAGLVSGEYAVEIVATSPAGEAKDTLRFRVTN
jgi:hypothetical protein